MSRERFRRAQEIFGEVCELDAEAQTRYLDARCAGDAELRGEIENLLAHDEATPEWGDTAAAAIARYLARTKPEPRRRT